LKANVIDISGNTVGQVDLPPAFDEEYRPDLIKRSVLAAQANRLQPYGPHFYAGMNSSARSWGPGHGVSRVPRVVNGRRGAIVPMARGGRRSHPPKPEADRSEKVNVKERRKAIRSAIAATSSIELVRARGHLFARDLPVVVQRNLPGVDFATIDGLNAELLAPGATAGRLTVWTESSLQKLAAKGSQETKQ
jgi:large subunit ribosomal protein L4e